MAKSLSSSAKKTRHRAPEFLANLLEYSQLVLVKNGIKPEHATKISREISKQMCDVWGKQLIYFPEWLREELSERDLRIYQEFNGYNHQDLARKYDLSIQAIYRIISIVRFEELSRRQGALNLEV